MIRFCIVLPTLALVTSLGFSQQQHPKIALTFDDPNLNDQPLLRAQDRAARVLVTLNHHHLQAALFVCGMRISSTAGDSLIQQWNKAGHLICNHSWSHWYYPAKKLPILTFYNDFLRCDSLIKKYSGYTKLFRFPYLKEGETVEKRDSMRLLLQQLGYG
ncbi:MAG TPA: polysaccharide deacetylase family protein, partial [Candidatus Kapabacteria bacterium]|nr:polysaccharide deacetylase family protein [Candidatus Kapabacteria bacterium]